MSVSKRHNRSVIDQFVDVLKNVVYTKIADLSGEAWKTPEPVPFSARQTGEHFPLRLGEQWGDLWDCAWMHITGKVPPSAKGKKVVARVDVAGEGCVYRADGYPIRGITTYSTFMPEFGWPAVTPVKRILDVAAVSTGDEEIDFWVDAGCNDLLGKLDDSATVKMLDLAVCDEVKRKFYYDYKFLSQLTNVLDENSSVRNQIEYTLYRVATDTDLDDPESVREAMERLDYHLHMENHDESLIFSAVGHSHIDLAWLWPIRETKRKGLRTFTTALRMMEKYPEYIFGASQPQLYQWVKDAAPGVFEEIRARVDEGRWECQGATWVEPDINLAGAEALVRQLVYGKRFFLEEFGKEMKILWLPDVFGYSASLPQILKKADVPYFMTIKLSWNEHNIFPYNTFRWVGIDGSEVLAHMPPENTYNSSTIPNSFKTAATCFKDKDKSNEALLLFGVGDGGGGPSTEHLEFLRREKSIVGIPQVTQRPAIEFFERIDRKRERYGKWVGELYLEKHQGTYTTQANSKKYNRILELALRDCEFSLVMAGLYADYPYPQAELEAIWKEVLLYQFHDILPGSSIKRVYDESIPRYIELHRQVLSITDAALGALATALGAGRSDTVAFNTLGFARTETVETPDGAKQVSIPAYGYAVVDAASSAPASAVRASDGVLENEFLKVVFSADGTLASLYDKQAEREVLNTGMSPRNNLVIYEDRGDCWDMPYTYLDKKPQSLQVVSMQTTDGAVTFTYAYGASAFTQTITLDDHAKLLRFHLDVDWQETFKMLRAVYPIDIRTDVANCEIQFGHIARPTHRNTSWDYAKFEVCAHKWVDLSETGFGVAMLNRGKYGFNVWDNTLSINLLRSQMYPGENADKGRHEIDYALFIHDGDLLRVTEEAYKFNVAPRTAHGQAARQDLPQTGSFVDISEPNVLLEAVKLAEDKSGYILRLYECCGKRTTATVRLHGARQAELTNLLERTERPLPLVDGGVRLTFKPFEIHTVKVISQSRHAVSGVYNNSKRNGGKAENV